MANGDFDKNKVEAIFTPNGPSVMYVDVPIMKDNIFEHTEHFTVHLELGDSVLSDATLVDPQSGTITMTEKGTYSSIATKYVRMYIHTYVGMYIRMNTYTHTYVL